MHMDVGVAKNDILKPMHGRTKNNSIRKFQCPINGHTHIFTKNAETSGKCSTWAGMWFPLSKYPFKFKYVCQTKPSVTTGEPSNYQLANFRFGYGSKNWAITACHFTFGHVRTKRPKVKGKIQADLEPYPVTFQCPGCSNFQIFNSPRRDLKWSQCAPMRTLSKVLDIWRYRPFWNVIFSCRNRRENHLN